MVSEEQTYRRIGEMIRARRKNIDMSQLQLSEKIGISRPSLANIEKGRQRVPIHLLYKLAQIFQITPSDLLPPMAEVIPLPQNHEKEFSNLSPKAKEFHKMILDK